MLPTVGGLAATQCSRTFRRPSRRMPRVVSVGAPFGPAVGSRRRPAHSLADPPIPPNPPSASGAYAVMTAFGARAAPEFLRWGLRVDVGEGIGVGIERRGVPQAPGQRFGRAAVEGGFVGGAEDCLHFGQQG